MYQKRRRQTREVIVGNVGVGGDNPIRIQSMTTSDTRDPQATIEQIIKLADYGCEIARVTVQGMKEADACEEIKNGLVQRGYDIPLVADIHFYPPAAMRVVEFADKVRINPGNYVDRRASFKVIEYDDKTYAQELEKLEEKFTPLVEKCKQYKRAMRIGTNHGSLSDRIMNRYGDTPAGMVESALEYTRVCRKLDFHNLIFSMKASNTRVMIEAYRQLVMAMNQEGWDYPLHLGVTEAGEGEDGRVKSAIGMGSLLLDGMGDTVRVSLTEDPWHEMDPCQRLVKLAENYSDKPFSQRPLLKRSPRQVVVPEMMHRDGSVFLVLNHDDVADPNLFQKLGCEVQLGRPVKREGSVDGVLTDCQDSKLEKLQDAGVAVLPLNPNLKEVTFVKASKERVLEARRIIDNLRTPVILQFSYHGDPEDIVIAASAEMGSLLCDGLAEGICLDAPGIDLEGRRSLAFAILQGSRMRSTKTEFISCPSCGRTLFDIQEVAKGIREKTAHLPGVKIAIMGCIVNGPGEMADADFGYVGSKPGMIDLYVGKTRVEKDIPMDDAVERLVDLIKAHGRWVEPKEEKDLLCTT